MTGNFYTEQNFAVPGVLVHDFNYGKTLVVCCSVISCLLTKHFCIPIVCLLLLLLLFFAQVVKLCSIMLGSMCY